MSAITTSEMREEYIWRNRPRPSAESAAEFADWLDEVRAKAWDEAYEQGIWDERTSEDNIGIAGMGGKVGPCRRNPYRAKGDLS